jgi:predicted metal-dependent HD superfamily phosphohydrolase
VRHVVDVVERVTRMSRSVPHRTRTALIAAAWYHDVVYNSRRADNEERSADVLMAELRRVGIDAGTTRTAARLIIETKRHRPRRLDTAAKILVDADLAVLASPAAAYDAYAAGIRREYAWVEDRAYHEGRARVLRSFLDRPRIFHTPSMRWSESAARANIEREIRALSDSTT